MNERGDFAMMQRQAEYERRLMEEGVRIDAEALERTIPSEMWTTQYQWVPGRAAPPPMFRPDMYSVVPLNGVPNPSAGALRERNEGAPKAELGEVLWTVA